jgi:hypothetical protein
MKYGPKSSASPTIGDPCPVCGVALAEGDYTALVRKSIKGKFSDDGVEVHWDCASTSGPRGTGELG